MKQHIYLLVFTFAFFSCSSEDDGNDPNNNPPANFSANAVGTGIDSGNVEWTESSDIIDNDPITYYVFLEDKLILVTPALTADFSGLEPDTGYDGYIEARDGNGGTSRADFTFLTDPEVIIFNVTAISSIWSETEVPGVGLSVSLSAGFVVPYYEDATSYQIEILEWKLGGIERAGQNQKGNIYTWTNESQSPPIGPLSIDQDISEGYGVHLAGAGIYKESDGYPDLLALYEATTGEARVTVVIGSSD